MAGYDLADVARGGCIAPRKGPYLHPMKSWTPLLLPALGLVICACLEDTDSAYRKLCDPIPHEALPASGSPNGGFEITLEGRFLSTQTEGLAEHDMAVRVGGFDAEVVSVETDGCDPCEACLIDSDYCLDCRHVCNGDEAYGDDQATCVEQVVIVAPPGDPGPAVISLFNAHGGAAQFDFDFLSWCEDGEDNDGDGLADGDDPGCTATAQASETGPCEDGADNDGDSWIDLDDPGCASDSSGVTEDLPGDTECNNGVDDDGDGLSDGADPECDDGYDTSESE